MKTIPFTAAHTHIAHIWQYPPPPPGQQGAPTTCNLEVSQQTYVQTLLASLGVVIWQNSALQWGLDRKLGVWPREEELTASVEGGQGFQHQIPSDTLNYLFPSNAFNFLPGTQNYFKIAQPAKICLTNRYIEDYIHWVPLDTPAMPGFVFMSLTRYGHFIESI